MFPNIPRVLSPILGQLSRSADNNSNIWNPTVPVASTTAPVEASFGSSDNFDQELADLFSWDTSDPFAFLTGPEAPAGTGNPYSLAEPYFPPQLPLDPDADLEQAAWRIRDPFISLTAPFTAVTPPRKAKANLPTQAPPPITTLPQPIVPQVPQPIVQPQSQVQHLPPSFPNNFGSNAMQNVPAQAFTGSQQAFNGVGNSPMLGVQSANTSNTSGFDPSFGMDEVSMFYNPNQFDYGGMGLQPTQPAMDYDLFQNPLNQMGYATNYQATASSSYSGVYTAGSSMNTQPTAYSTASGNIAGLPATSQAPAFLGVSSTHGMGPLPTVPTPVKSHPLPTQIQSAQVAQVPPFHFQSRAVKQEQVQQAMRSPANANLTPQANPHAPFRPSPLAQAAALPPRANVNAQPSTVSFGQGVPSTSSVAPMPQKLQLFSGGPISWMGRRRSSVKRTQVPAPVVAMPQRPPMQMSQSSAKVPVVPMVQRPVQLVGPGVPFLGDELKQVGGPLTAAAPQGPGRVSNPPGAQLAKPQPEGGAAPAARVVKKSTEGKSKAKAAEAPGESPGTALLQSIFASTPSTSSPKKGKKREREVDEEEEERPRKVTVTKGKQRSVSEKKQIQVRAEAVQDSHQLLPESHGGSGAGHMDRQDADQTPCIRTPEPFTTITGARKHASVKPEPVDLSAIHLPKPDFSQPHFAPLFKSAIPLEDLTTLMLSALPCYWGYDGTGEPCGHVFGYRSIKHGGPSVNSHFWNRWGPHRGSLPDCEQAAYCLWPGCTSWGGGKAEGLVSSHMTCVAHTHVLTRFLYLECAHCGEVVKRTLEHWSANKSKRAYETHETHCKGKTNSLWWVRIIGENAEAE